VISKADGDSARFDAIYNQYYANKEVTRSRLYLEAVEGILQESDKVIMGGEGMLPHMSVQQKDSLENR
jgi:membrane protease subunit HflK